MAKGLQIETVGAICFGGGFKHLSYFHPFFGEDSDFDLIFVE